MAIMNKRTMADDTRFFQYRSVTSYVSVELCSVIAMLLHFYRSKIERLFSDGQFFTLILVNGRRCVWFTVDFACPARQR